MLEVKSPSLDSSLWATYVCNLGGRDSIHWDPDFGALLKASWDCWIQPFLLDSLPGVQVYGSVLGFYQHYSKGGASPDQHFHSRHGKVL